MPLEFAEICIRVGLAFISGCILGLERETRGRPAGLRTIALVCVASALAAILSDSYYRGSFEGAYESTTWHPDPARLAAGILTGIGFLGAGVIIQQENWVRGVTTASQIWFVTILGLCYGSGEIRLGLLGLGVSFVTVYFLHKIELFMKRDCYAFLTVETSLDGTKPKELTTALDELGNRVLNTELQRDMVRRTSTVVFRVRYAKKEEDKMCEKVVSKISTLPGVNSVHWK